MGGHLANGRLEGTVVTCPRHGSRFDLRDGSVIRWTDFSGLGLRLAKTLRSPRPLQTYPVRVEDGRLLVDLGAGD
jgi:3-phenylpropionate/trans-cinnamate dioxygenase ferredoxin subunit